MKTVILDENQYPFQIEPEFIKANFALFSNISREREELTLLLFSDSGSSDQIIHNQEMDVWGDNCVASGSFSYQGPNPQERDWTPEINKVSDKLSGAAMSALRSDVFTQVIKCIKGENLDSQTTLRNKRADTVCSSNGNRNNEDTNIVGIPLNINPDVSKIRGTEKGSQLIGKEITLNSVFPQPVRPQTIYPKEEQQTVVI